MAPFVPYHNSAGQTTIVKFGGLLTTEFLEPPPGRCFLFRQTYRHNVEGPIPENLRKLINSPKRPKGPPVHLHRFQTEYFRVESGIMGICIDGKHLKFTPEDGEFTVTAGTVHQFYIHPDSPESMTIYISASDSGKDRELDRVFFENWYGYWHDALLHGKGLSLLQVLAIHDGGDAYLLAPKWVPFRRQLAYYGGIILGRWIGGLLGYQPFYREYTTDWDFAVAKMEGSFFQRRFAKKAYKSKKSWAQQAKLEAPVKPYNAGLEPLTTDLDPMPLRLGPAAYEGGHYRGKNGDSAEMAKMNGLNGVH